jgi:uncharacterized phage protein (TIGR01671 family)
MREILFRGKRTDDGEWVYGYYVMAEGDYHHILSGKLDFNGHTCDFEYKRVDPATVVQFTGLYDKNGVRIFEGDIISVTNLLSDDPHLATVCFGKYAPRNESQAYNIGLFVEWHDKKYLRQELKFWVDEYWVEIVGNIHDLKGEK